MIEELIKAIEIAKKVDSVWTEKQIKAGIKMFMSVCKESDVRDNQSDEYSGKNANWMTYNNFNS